MNKKKRYSADELLQMSLDSLQKVGKPLKLKFSKNHNRPKRVEKILAAYVAEDASTVKPKLGQESPSVQDADISSNVPPSADSASPLLGERKPTFEKLASAAGEPVGAVGSDPADGSSPRGGKRPGAGRPSDMTDELVLYNSLPQQPHPAIKDALEVLFKMWSTRAKCPEIALTKEQAFELALPYTQMAELFGITGFIPAWLMVGITCGWTTWNLISVKAEIARAAMAQRKPADPVEPAIV